MIYLFSFEGLREIEESRYRLPQKLIVQSFEEGFLLREGWNISSNSQRIMRFFPEISTGSCWKSGGR